MNKNRLMIMTGAILSLTLITALTYVGCGGKSSSGSSSVAKLAVSGTVGSGYDVVASRPANFLEKFCSIFSPAFAWAASGTPVNKILAVPYDGGAFDDYSVRNIKEIPINPDRTFTMSL